MTISASADDLVPYDDNGLADAFLYHQVNRTFELMSAHDNWCMLPPPPQLAVGIP